MSEAITVSPPAESPPPRRGWTKTSWAIILLGVMAVIALHLFPITAAEEAAVNKEESGMALVMLELQGRYFIGAHLLLHEQVPNLYDQLLPLNRGSPDERLRFMTLASEIKGPAEALRRLHEFDKLCGENHVTLSEKDRRLRVLLGRLYRAYDGGDRAAKSLAADDRAYLAQQMGWFGRLALNPPGTESPEREAVLEPAERTFVAFAAAFVLVVLLILAGIGGLIGFLVINRRGGISWHFTAGSAASGIYVETFAWWVILYPGVSLLLALTLGIPTLPRAATAMLLSLVVLAWPLLRGVSWQQLRQDIGLHFGRNPLLEMAAGIACYVIMLPLVLVGMAISVALLVIQAQLAAAEAGPAQAGADFTSAPGPSHPIILLLAHGDVLTWIQVYALASFVAPLVEETMFRGFLYRHCRELTHRLGRAGSAVLSALVVSFLFAAVHPQGLMLVPPLMCLALGFCLAREWRGALLPSMFAHGVNNGLVTTLAMIALSS